MINKELVTKIIRISLNKVSQKCRQRNFCSLLNTATKRQSLSVHKHAERMAAIEKRKWNFFRLSPEYIKCFQHSPTFVSSVSEKHFFLSSTRLERSIMFYRMFSAHFFAIATTFLVVWKFLAFSWICLDCHLRQRRQRLQWLQRNNAISLRRLGVFKAITSRAHLYSIQNFSS